VGYRRQWNGIGSGFGNKADRDGQDAQDIVEINKDYRKKSLWGRISGHKNMKFFLACSNTMPVKAEKIP
jgi:hypothetical protein